MILSLDYGQRAYANIFAENGFNVKRQLGYHPIAWYDIDSVLFTGGTDVNPEMYGQKNLMSSTDEARDLLEVHIWRRAKKLSLPCIGICRGSQFLTVMNGGKLVQDVKGHLGNHAIQTDDGRNIRVTSTHHQMMLPDGTEHVVRAWSQHGAYKVGEGGKEIYQPIDPEVVFYPKTNDLAVQYHPEYMDKESQGYQYFVELINEVLK